MLFYIFKRVLLMIPTLLGAAVLVFLLMRAIPGDVCVLRQATGGSGIRMLAHKESRVIYFSPKDMAGGSTGAATGPTVQTTAVKNILSKFTRYHI